MRSVSSSQSHLCLLGLVYLESIHSRLVNIHGSESVQKEIAEDRPTNCIVYSSKSAYRGHLAAFENSQLFLVLRVFWFNRVSLISCIDTVRERPT